MGKQKRSENTYQKINTIFYRDEKNVIMQHDAFTEPEFEYLRGLKWRGECKIDGTNIRLEVHREIIYNREYENNVDLVETDEVLGVKFNVSYKGKTDSAQVPPKLLKYLEETYPKEKILESLGLAEEIDAKDFADHKWETAEDVPYLYTIYGEGYGAGIQKAGGNYIKDGVGFAVFDVKVNSTWLKVEARNEIAGKLGAPVVPFIGYFTLDEAIEYVKKGFKTGLWDNKDMFEEGLVLRTEPGLLNRMGKRIITKIKYEDFEKYRRVYGTDDPVDQVRNPHYSE
jgi:hypothetical protein